MVRRTMRRLEGSHQNDQSPEAVRNAKVIQRTRFRRRDFQKERMEYGTRGLYNSGDYSLGGNQVSALKTSVARSDRLPTDSQSFSSTIMERDAPLMSSSVCRRPRGL